MEILAAIGLIERAFKIGEALLNKDTIADAKRAYDVASSLFKGIKNNDVSDADLEKNEAVLDALITEFNIPLPPA